MTLVELVERDGARAEQQHDRADGDEGARPGDDRPDAAPLPVDELADRHETGRLVTAYTKRFTPMRNAASRSAGGSLCTSASSQPFPRSLS